MPGKEATWELTTTLPLSVISQMLLEYGVEVIRLNDEGGHAVNVVVEEGGHEDLLVECCDDHNIECRLV